MAEAKHSCSCELCRPNLWLGAFDESVDSKTAKKLDELNDRLEEEHRQKLVAARKRELALAPIG